MVSPKKIPNKQQWRHWIGEFIQWNSGKAKIKKKKTFSTVGGWFIQLNQGYNDPALIYPPNEGTLAQSVINLFKQYPKFFWKNHHSLKRSRSLSILIKNRWPSSKFT
jgi:hypothetical protein